MKNFDFSFFKCKKHIAKITFGVVIILLAILCFKPRNPAFVSFDFKSTYNAFLVEAAKEKILPEQLKLLGMRFPNAVNRAVNEYATKHHAIVFMSGAVMAGVVDATAEIQKLIAKEMQRENG